MSDALIEEARVREALPWVDAVARRLAGQLSVDADDLRSAGHFALMDFVRQFDGRVPFEPFVRGRLRWAMLDEIRRTTKHRTVRAKAAALVASLELTREAADGAALAVESMPRSEGAYAEALRAVLREHATAMGLSLLAGFGVTPSSRGPERIALGRDRAAAVHRAIEMLADHERAVVMRHYFEGESLSHIARSWERNKSWVSRAHRRAMANLAVMLCESGVVSTIR